MNDGKFDGGQSSKDEKELHNFYKRVMSIAATNPAITGEYKSLHSMNLSVDDSAYSEQQFAFIRKKDGHGLVVIANFSDKSTGPIEFTIPLDVIGSDGEIKTLKPLLSHESISLEKGIINYQASLSLDGLETKVFAF
jgi:hypothetical protein